MTNDRHLLTQFRRELLLQTGPGVAGGALERPVPLVRLLVLLVDPVPRQAGVGQLDHPLVVRVGADRLLALSSCSDLHWAPDPRHVLLAALRTAHGP